MGPVPTSIDPWVWAVVAVLVLGFFPTLSAYLNRRDTKAIRHQVQNSHSTNMREEQDQRHNEVLNQLSQIRSTLGSVDRRTVRIGDEVIDDRTELYRLRAEVYAEIRAAKDHRSRHDTEGGS